MCNRNSKSTRILWLILLQMKRWTWFRMHIVNWKIFIMRHLHYYSRSCFIIICRQRNCCLLSVSIAAHLQYCWIWLYYNIRNLLLRLVKWLEWFRHKVLVNQQLSLLWTHFILLVLHRNQMRLVVFRVSKKSCLFPKIRRIRQLRFTLRRTTKVHRRGSKSSFLWLSIRRWPKL